MISLDVWLCVSSWFFFTKDELEERVKKWKLIGMASGAKMLSTFEGLINIDRSKNRRRKESKSRRLKKQTKKGGKRRTSHFKIETTRREISLERKNVLFFYPLSRWRDSLALHKAAQFAFENRCFAARFYRRGISSRPRYTVALSASMRAHARQF